MFHSQYSVIESIVGGNANWQDYGIDDDGPVPVFSNVFQKTLGTWDQSLFIAWQGKGENLGGHLISPLMKRGSLGEAKTERGVCQI